MSRKSRPPKASKKGRKGKKGQQFSSTSVVVEESAGGPPFGMIVLVAFVLSIPSLMSFVDGSMAFDATVLRFMAALAVAWLLINLVFAVANSFRNEKATTMEQHSMGPDAGGAYRTPGEGMPPGAQ